MKVTIDVSEKFLKSLEQTVALKNFTDNLDKKDPIDALAVVVLATAWEVRRNCPAHIQGIEPDSIEVDGRVVMFTQEKDAK